MLHTQFFFVCSNNENKVVGKVFVPNKDIRKRFNEMYSREFYISETEIPFYQLRSFKDYSIVKYRMTRRKIETNVGFYFIRVFKEVLEKRKRRLSKDISQTISKKQINNTNNIGVTIMQYKIKLMSVRNNKSSLLAESIVDSNNEIQKKVKLFTQTLLNTKDNENIIDTSLKIEIRPYYSNN
jgi:hypothetical protein